MVPVASPLVMAEQALPEAVGRAMLDGSRSRPGVEWITVDLSAAQEAIVSDSARLIWDGAIARYWRHYELVVLERDYIIWRVRSR